MIVGTIQQEDDCNWQEASKTERRKAEPTVLERAKV